MLFFDLGSLIVDGPEAARAANKQDFFDFAKMNQVQNEMDLFNTQQSGKLAAAQVESDTIGTAASQLYQQGAIPTLAQGRSDSLLGTAAVQSLTGNYNQAAAAATTPLIPQLTSLRALTELQNTRNAQNQAAAVVPLQQQVAIAGLEGQQQLVPLQTNLGVSQLNGAIAAQPLINSNNIVNQGQIVPAQQGLQIQQIDSTGRLLPLQTTAEVNRLQTVVPAQQSVQVAQAQQQQTLIPQQTTAEVNRLQTVVPAQQAAQIQTANATGQVAAPRAAAEVNRLQTVVPAQQKLNLSNLTAQLNSAEQRQQNATAQRSAQITQAQLRQRTAHARTALLDIGSLNQRPDPMTARRISQSLVSSGLVPAGSTVTPDSNENYGVNMPGGTRVPLNTVGSQIQSQLTGKSTAGTRTPATNSAPEIDLSQLIGTGKVTPLGPQPVAQAQATISPVTVAEWRREDSDAWRIAQLNVLSNPETSRLAPDKRKAAIMAELDRLIGVWTSGQTSN